MQPHEPSSSAFRQASATCSLQRRKPSVLTRVGLAILSILVGCNPGDTSYTTTNHLPSSGGLGAPYLYPEEEEQGWTNFQPSLDTRVVYVSSSTGNDNNNGLSESSPKRTIAAGKSLMRHGFPDWLLLKRGDVWTESLGQWRVSGRSPSEMMLIGSYGTATQRPLLLTGTSHGLFTNLGGGSAPSIDYVAFVGIHFTPHLYVGVGSPSGFSWLVGGTHLLIEDCLFERYMNNLTIQGFDNWRRNTTIRRNVLREAFATTAATSGQGLYAAGCDGLTIEENVFDHNGWCESIPGAVPSIFRHGIYIQTGSGRGNNHNVVVSGNIIANSAATGLQLRSGGICRNNLFLRNPIHVLLGGGHQLDFSGVEADFHDNVLLDGRDIDAINPRGWCVTAANIRRGEVRRNLIAHQVNGTAPRAFDLDSNHGVGISNLSFLNNVIYNWSDAGCLQVVGTKFQDITVFGNQFQEYRASGSQALFRSSDAQNLRNIFSGRNTFHSNANASRWIRVGQVFQDLQSWKNTVGDTSSVAMAVPYPMPSRNIESYSVSVGGNASLSDFMANACLQSRTSWRPLYTAREANTYFRLGFNM